MTLVGYWLASLWTQKALDTSDEAMSAVLIVVALWPLAIIVMPLVGLNWCLRQIVQRIKKQLVTTNQPNGE